MKKIFKSLSLIIAVAAIAIGGTVAYFSDNEQSTGNTIASATLDITVDGINNWSTPFVVSNMLPGEVEAVDYVIDNVGSVGAIVKKDINVTGDDNDPVSEPECQAEGGTWDDTTTPNCIGGSAIVDLENQLDYTLYVELYDGASATGNMVWSQKIKTGTGTLYEAYANGELLLGMIPSGYSMKVYQEYEMKTTAGNEYQGDTLEMSLDFNATQQGTLVLENKNTSDWSIKEDLTQATLTYATRARELEFDFDASGLSASTAYSLITYPESFSTGSAVVLGTFTTDGSGAISVSDQSIDLGESLGNMKVWLVPSADLTGAIPNWGNMAGYLWDTALMDYTDSDL